MPKITAPICPANAAHGALSLRAKPSRDAQWCGTWYDCRHCYSNVLIPSEELKQQRKEQGASYGD